MASIRLWYCLVLAMLCERPIEWLDLMFSSCSMGSTKVENRSRNRPLAWRTRVLISELTRVLKTMGRCPSAVKAASIRAATSAALSTESMKGSLIWRKRAFSNCARTEWAKVSAVMPVPSETTNTVRRYEFAAGAG